jgi:hypothetical protein
MREILQHFPEPLHITHNCLLDHTTRTLCEQILAINRLTTEFAKQLWGESVEKLWTI